MASPYGRHLLSSRPMSPLAYSTPPSATFRCAANAKAGIANNASDFAYVLWTNATKQWTIGDRLISDEPLRIVETCSSQRKSFIEK